MRGAHAQTEGLLRASKEAAAALPSPPSPSDGGKRADLPQNAHVSASPQPHHQRDALGKLKALGHQPAGLGLLLTLLGTEGLSRGFPNSVLLAGEI